MAVVKDLNENPLDRMLNDGLEKREVVEPEEVSEDGDADAPHASRGVPQASLGVPQTRKRGRPPIPNLTLHSLYMEEGMWAEMKVLAKRVGVGTRSALIRMLISRLSDRVRKADYARQTAEKNLKAALDNRGPKP